MINATAAALLGLLRPAPLTGYALVQAAQEVLGNFWTVTRSQVYRELAAMADKGLVAPEQTGARDARPYRITPAGEEAFHAWLHGDQGSDVVRIPLLLRLAFVDDLDRGRLREMLAETRAAHEAKLALYREYEAACAGHPPRQLLTLRFGIRYEETVLAWLDEADAAV